MTMGLTYRYRILLIAVGGFVDLALVANLFRLERRDRRKTP